MAGGHDCGSWRTRPAPAPLTASQGGSGTASRIAPGPANGVVGHTSPPLRSPEDAPLARLLAEVAGQWRTVRRPRRGTAAVPREGKPARLSARSRTPAGVMPAIGPIDKEG